MVHFLIRRPIAVIMLFIAAMILGIISYNTIPVSLMPDIPVPNISVNINYKNSSARELENAVVKRLRAQLLQVGHLSDIKSETRNGMAVIHLQFDYGTNMNYAFIETNEKIDAAMNALPRDMERPKVVKSSATDIPVFYLNISLKNADSLKADASDQVDNRFIELCEFSENVIRKRIEQLPEVSLVDISGTVSPQMVITPDMDKLQNLNITLSQLENVLSQNNIDIGSLMVRDGYYQYNIRFTSLLRTKEDVENIYIKISGKIIQLKEIATVNLLPEQRTGMFASNGKPAVTMAIIKQADARMSDMKGKIKEMLGWFERDYPEIHFEASQDQTELLDVSISNLKQNLLQGLLLVALVVFLFLKDFKSPLLIGTTLIISIIICMLFFRIFNLSLNIISLAGLILAVGNMMDNSIVVTDNITQYRERGLSIDEACVSGTNEVMIPMLSSVLTNVSIFLPMIFISGMAGALMYDEALSVTIGLAVSYIVGITLMPVIYRLAYKNTRKTSGRLERLKNQLFNYLGGHVKKVFNLDTVYEKGLDFTFKHKRTNLILYSSLIPIGILVVFMMRKEKMPPLPQTEVIIKVDWNENIHVGENKRRVIELLKAINEKTKQSNCYIGHQQFLLNRDEEMTASEARIYIKASQPDDISWIEANVKEVARKKFPESQLSFSAPTSIFEKLFSSSEPPLVAEVSLINTGSSFDIPSLLQLNRDLNNNRHLQSVNKIPLQGNIILSVNLEKLLLYNVSYDALYKELKTSFKENYVGTLRSYQQYIPLVISGNTQSIANIIEHSKVRSADNNLVPVNALVTISHGQDMKTITAGKNGEYIPFSFDPDSKQQASFLKEIKTTVSKNKNYNVNFSGSLFTSSKMLKELGIVLIISVLLLYLILAAQFESLVQPFLVLLELPIDFAGALLFLYLLGESLNLMSAIGIIVMSGIIINDSILKLDVINQLRKEGYPLLEAIKVGGHRRLRAILMTSLTSILAMIPLLFSNDLGSELQKPFSYGLIGGMVIGTVVSLYLVPLAYYYIYRNEKIKTNR